MREKKIHLMFSATSCCSGYIINAKLKFRFLCFADLGSRSTLNPLLYGPYVYQYNFPQCMHGNHHKVVTALYL